MSKITVDKEKCIGCGACVGIDSEHFGFDENGLSEVINEVPGDDTITAKEACPVDAIDIVEE